MTWRTPGYGDDDQLILAYQVLGAYHSDTLEPLFDTAQTHPPPPLPAEGSDGPNPRLLQKLQDLLMSPVELDLPALTSDNARLVLWGHCQAPLPNALPKLPNPDSVSVCVAPTSMEAGFQLLQAHDVQREGPIHDLMEVLASSHIDLSQLDDDDGSAAVRAQVHADAFQPVVAGSRWSVNAKPTQRDQEDSADQPALQQQTTVNIEPPGLLPACLEALRVLNRAQSAADVGKRHLTRAQRDVFHQWWQTRGDQSVNEKAAGVARARAEQDKREAEVQRQVERMNTDMLKDLNYELQSRPLDSFYAVKDPVVVVTGVEDGWGSVEGNDTVTLQSFVAINWVDRLKKLYNNRQMGRAFEEVQTGRREDRSREDRSREDRSRQPWFPLFLEWEVQWFDAPFDRFQFTENSAEAGGADAATRMPADTSQPSVFYTLTGSPPTSPPEGIPLAGRNLLLPSNRFTLVGRLKQLWAQDLDLNDNPSALSRLADLINNWKCLSHPLQGFTDQLLARRVGSHRVPQGKVSATIDHAWGELLRGDQALKAVTPGEATMLFHGAQHGQFGFKKLSIVDRFNQRLTVLEGQLQLRHGAAPTVYCSPHYQRRQTEPELSGGHHQLLGCVQLQPKLLQAGRLLSHWALEEPSAPLIPTASTSPAVVPQERNPIQGWLMVSHLNRSCQVYTTEGLLFCQLRLLADGSAVTEDREVQKLVDPNAKLTISTSMQRVVKRLREPDGVADPGATFRAFMDLFSAAEDCTTLSSSRAFPSLVLGRPLAVVDVDWSLQLSERPLLSSTFTEANPSFRLFTTTVTDPGVKPYEFPVRLGNVDLTTDGLLGYFLREPPNIKDLGSFYSDYCRVLTEKQALNATNAHIQLPYSQPPLRPHVLDEQLTDVTLLGRAGGVLTGKAITDPRLLRTTILCDPFQPVHAQTGILPVYRMDLPRWCVERGLSQMMSAFKVGPFIVTDDSLVTQWSTWKMSDDLRRQEEANRMTTAAGHPDKFSACISMAIPSTAANRWEWMQRVEIRKEDRVEEKDEEKQKDIPAAIDWEGKNYRPFVLKPIPSTPETTTAHQRGPFRVVHGFLKLRASGMDNAS